MAITVTDEQQIGIFARLWIYQRERLPFGKTATLLALFSAASINVSAALAGIGRPGIGAYVVAFICAFVFFAQLRACDEIKDGEEDARFRPERPIPRGLVTIETIVGIGIALVPLAALVAWLRAPVLLWPLALVWLWMGLMTFEFFVPDWLKARPVAYLVSHMAIMPLIDLFVTACEWLPRAWTPPAGLWIFLALSFVNGCVIEIGRKIYAPSAEREGVETYSKAWGIERALGVWATCLVASAALLIAVGVKLGAGVPVTAVAAVALAAALWTAHRFHAARDTQAQKRIDLVAGLWVALCYGTAGLAPLLPGWLS